MSIERTTSGATVFTGMGIQLYRLTAQKYAVGLELKGMKRKGGPLWKALRDYYKIPGTGKRQASMQQVYDWLVTEIERVRELDEVGGKRGV